MKKKTAMWNINALSSVPGNATKDQMLDMFQYKVPKSGKVSVLLTGGKKKDRASIVDLQVCLHASLECLAKEELTSVELSHIQRAIRVVTDNMRAESATAFVQQSIPEKFKELSYKSVHTQSATNVDRKKGGIKEKKPVPNVKGQYVISEGKNDTNHMGEAFWIGLETQLKRILRALFSRFTNKWDYFSKGEDKLPDQIYAKTDINPVFGANGEVKIHNISHASMLIQTQNINILTDPVFGGLAPIVYPAKTRAAIEVRDLPRIDVIVISHNHRDHFDINTLKQILANGQNPTIIVPPGNDKAAVESLGFTDVVELNWFEKMQFTKNGKTVDITATGADHWTNRSASDANLSSVNSYVIAPQEGKGVVYFAGDTAVMSEQRMKSISAILRLEVMSIEARQQEAVEIYNLEPGGPNYSRALMKTTHQSAVDSVISAFKIARDIAALDQELLKPEEILYTPQEWLEKTVTTFMHHNKFELGPDRFNENKMIYERLVEIIKNANSKEELVSELDKIRREEVVKGYFDRKLFNRCEDFIYQGALECIEIYSEIVNKGSKVADFNELKSGLVQILEQKVKFPKIGEAISSDELTR